MAMAGIAQASRVEVQEETMTKKARKRSGGGGRRKRTKGQKAVVHITDLLVIIWLLERMGVLTQQFYAQLISGNIAGCIAEVQNGVKNNFTGSGVATTIASGAGLAIALGLLRLALRGHTMNLKKPKSIAV